MSKIPLLKIKNASFGYNIGFNFCPIISNVNIEIFKGDFIIIEGPNGCGKSTILKGLLKLGAFFKGEVNLYIPIQKIGYIPQEIKIDSSAPFSVIDIIKSAFPFQNISQKEIIDSLNIVGMVERKNFRFGLLSGGEKRKVLLARALATDSDLIILDEPTSGIDKESKNKLEEILYLIVSNKNKAILATSHSSNWATKAVRYYIQKEYIQC